MDKNSIRRTVESLVKDALNAQSENFYNNAVSLSLEKAKVIANAVQTRASQMGVKAVIALANASGNLQLVYAMEDSYVASVDIAINKAYTAAALKMPTTKLAELAAPGGELYGLQHTNGGKIVIFGGGEPLIYRGQVIGALGVSGGSLKQDVELALFGRQVFSELTQ